MGIFILIFLDIFLLNILFHAWLLTIILLSISAQATYSNN